MKASKKANRSSSKRALNNDHHRSEKHLREVLKNVGQRNLDGEYSLVLPCIINIDGFRIVSISIHGDFQWLYACGTDGIHHYLDEEAAEAILKSLIRQGIK